jgi:hypothetical protein
MNNNLNPLQQQMIRQQQMRQQQMRQQQQMRPNMPLQQQQMRPNMPQQQQQMRPNMPQQQQQMRPNMPLQQQQMRPNMPQQQQQMRPNMPQQQQQMRPNMPLQQQQQPQHEQIIMKNNIQPEIPQQKTVPTQIIKPNKLLMDIKNKNLIFVSAQPDNTYFHWQVEVYMYQFSKFGIIDNCHVLFGYTGDGPSEGGLKLQKMYKNIHFYKDERVDKTYIPTIRPHILAKFFKEYPYLGKNVFYHDSDILFVKLSNFSLMLHDKISYLSDTVSYIGYNYIMDCCKRYKEKHQELADDDLFLGMCKEANISPNLVKINQQNSGGAQYLLKNINSTYWEDCEKTCVSLYNYMCEYERKYPVDHHIQKWTADMWAVLWNYWKIGGVTKIHTELDFSWATDSMDQYKSKNIFHLAGVSGETSKDRFYKAQYTNKNVIDEYIGDNTIFNHIIPTSATYGYTRVIIECAKKRSIISASFADNNMNPEILQNQEDNLEANLEENKQDKGQVIEPEKVITDEFNNINIDGLSYFTKRRVLYCLSNGIPIDDIVKKPVYNNSKSIRENTTTTIEKIENDEPEATVIFNKFLHIKSGNVNVNDNVNVNVNENVNDNVNDSEYVNLPSLEINKPVPPKTEQHKYVTKLVIEGYNICSNTYIMDNEVTCCKKNIWRSIDNKLIIFFNGSVWIITYALDEKNIGSTSGGISSNLSPDLLINKWNFDCTTKVIKDVL